MIPMMTPRNPNSSGIISIVVVVVGGLLLGCYIECYDISQDEKCKT